MGKRRIRIVWHGFKGRRKVRDSGAIALKNLGNSVLEEQRRQRKTRGEKDEVAPGILKEIKKWFAKQFSKICHCGFWRRNQVGIFDPVYQFQSTAIPDVPSSSGQSSDPVCIYTAENSPSRQQEINFDYDGHNDDANFHQKFSHSMVQLPKIRKMRHTVKQMKENSERILKIEKDCQCSPTPIHRNIMQDVNLPGMLVDDHVEFKTGRRDENDDVKKLCLSPAVASSSIMPDFFILPRPIGFWCPLNITLENAQNIIMEFPKCIIPTLFEAMTAAERYCARLRTVKLEEDIKTVNIQNRMKSLNKNTDFSITSSLTDQDNHTSVVNKEPNPSVEMKNSVGNSNDTDQTEFHKEQVERCHNTTNSLSPPSKATPTWGLSEKKYSEENQKERNQNDTVNDTQNNPSSSSALSQSENQLKNCETHSTVGVCSSEDSKLTGASIGSESFPQPRSFHSPIHRFPLQSGNDQSKNENQNRAISSKESTEVTEPVTDDEIADMIREIENNMDSRNSA